MDIRGPLATLAGAVLMSAGLQEVDRSRTRSMRHNLGSYGYQWQRRQSFARTGLTALGGVALLTIGVAWMRAAVRAEMQESETDDEVGATDEVRVAAP